MCIRDSYLNPAGEPNILAVEVHKFADATWMEKQDMIRDGGIFRDVYLFATPLVHINDYQLETDLDDQYQDATLKMDVNVKNFSSVPVDNYAVEAVSYTHLDVYKRQQRGRWRLLWPEARLPSDRLSWPHLAVRYHSAGLPVA